MKGPAQFDLEHYRRHYGGELSIQHAATPYDNARFISRGSRYWLAVQRLRGNVDPSDLVVEMGCGDARILFEITRQNGLQNVTGLDGAFDRPVAIGPVALKCHNLNEPWPFDDGSIRYIIAMMIFEHLFSPFHCFQEVKRTLSPNGTAFVNLPLVTSVKNRLRLLLGRLPETSVREDLWFERKEWDGGHLHYFSIASIKRLAATCGLRVDEVHGVGRFYRLKSMLPNLLASEVTFSLKHA